MYALGSVIPARSATLRMPSEKIGLGVLRLYLVDFCLSLFFLNIETFFSSFPVLPLNKTRANFLCCRKPVQIFPGEPRSLSGRLGRAPPRVRTLPGLGAIPAPRSSPVFSLQTAPSCPDVLKCSALEFMTQMGLHTHTLPLFICLKSLPSLPTGCKLESLINLLLPSPVVNIYPSL